MSATITEDNLPNFIKKYEEAVNHKMTKFTFEGDMVATTYAKYVIEYMKPDHEPKLWTGNQ